MAYQIPLGEIVKVMERGQITIPASIRKKLNIKSKTSLNLVIKDGILLACPLMKIIKANGKRKFPKGKPTVIPAKFKGKKALMDLRKTRGQGTILTSEDYQNYLTKKEGEKKRAEKIKQLQSYWND